MNIERTVKKFMSSLSEQIKKNNASAFTHSGKFHADDVFSAALLLYLNPEINISRGNKVPEDFDGIVFDIGRGQYDHHQMERKFLVRNWRKSSTSPLCSPLITTTIQGRKMSLPH